MGLPTIALENPTNDVAFGDWMILCNVQLAILHKRILEIDVMLKAKLGEASFFACHVSVRLLFGSIRIYVFYWILALGNLSK